jgi:hypothetical protein
MQAKKHLMQAKTLLVQAFPGQDNTKATDGVSHLAPPVCLHDHAHTVRIEDFGETFCPIRFRWERRLDLIVFEGQGFIDPIRDMIGAEEKACME